MPSVELITKDSSNNLVKRPIAAPVGAVFFYAAANAPAHALVCNGALISRTAYPELFAAIGTTFGAGDGSTTFALPDLAGKFLRGTGGNAAALGTAQGDAIRNISGQLLSLYSNETLFFQNPSDMLIGVFTLARGPFMSNVDITDGNANDSAYGVNFNASYVVPTATENRPVNIALLPCIIYE